MQTLLCGWKGIFIYFFHFLVLETWWKKRKQLKSEERGFLPLLLFMPTLDFWILGVFGQRPGSCWQCSFMLFSFIPPICWQENIYSLEPNLVLPEVRNGHQCKLPIWHTGILHTALLLKPYIENEIFIYIVSVHITYCEVSLT